MSAFLKYLLMIIFIVLNIDRVKIPSVTSDIELYPMAKEGDILSGRISDDKECDNLFPADGTMYLTTDKIVSSKIQSIFYMGTTDRRLLTHGNLLTF